MKKEWGILIGLAAVGIMGYIAYSMWKAKQEEAEAAEAAAVAGAEPTPSITSLMLPGPLEEYLITVASVLNVKVINVAPTSFTVSAGGNAEAIVEWQNVGQSSYAAKFRYDIRRAGFAATWTEGVVITSETLSPQITTYTRVHCSIPASWGTMTIDAKLMVIGLSKPAWTKNEVYQILAEVSAAAPTEAAPAEEEWVPSISFLF